MAVLVLAVVMSIAALVAADDDDATTSAASSVHVSLSEFAITPSAVSVPAGGMLHVANDGAVVHNLAMCHQVATADLPAGEVAELDLGDLAPGDYTVACLIPGHADSGIAPSPFVATTAAQPRLRGCGQSHDGYGLRGDDRGHVGDHGRVSGRHRRRRQRRPRAH